MQGAKKISQRRICVICKQEIFSIIQQFDVAVFLEVSFKFFGESPSGKAPDFDSGIRRFDPYLPSQYFDVCNNLRGVWCPTTA